MEKELQQQYWKQLFFILAWNASVSSSFKLFSSLSFDTWKQWGEQTNRFYCLLANMGWLHWIFVFTCGGQAFLWNTERVNQHWVTAQDCCCTLWADMFSHISSINDVTEGICLWQRRHHCGQKGNTNENIDQMDLQILSTLHPCPPQPALLEKPMIVVAMDTIQHCNLHILRQLCSIPCQKLLLIQTWRGPKPV